MATCSLPLPLPGDSDLVYVDMGRLSFSFGSVAQSVVYLWLVCTLRDTHPDSSDSPL